MPESAAGLDFRGVQGFSETTALVMSSGKGDLSRVYRTTDGCKSWTLVFLNPDPDGAWQSMQFQWHPGNGAEPGYFGYGVLVGNPVGGEFVIFTSKNHGITWQALRDDEAFSPGPPAPARTGESVSSLSNTALTATADQGSFAFVTGGAGASRLLYPQGATYDFSYTALRYTFAQVPLPLSVPGAATVAFSVGARQVTADRVDLMVVGGDPGRPELGSAAFVRHGGVSLKKLVAPRATAATRPPSGFRCAVAYDSNGSEWIAVGPTGTDVSRDDGRTWTPLGGASTDAPDADKHWQALSLPFVVGPGGRIGKLHGSGPSLMVAAK